MRDESPENWERALLRILVSRSQLRHYSLTLFYLLLISSQIPTGLALDLQHSADLSRTARSRQSSSSRYPVQMTYCQECYKALYNNAASLSTMLPVEVCVNYYNAMKCINKDKTLAECFENNPINKMQMHSYFQLKYKLLNCDQVIQMASIDLENQTLPPPPPPDPSIDNQCEISPVEEVSLSSPPRFCALFGDPHLVTYSGETQTCAAVGAWPLVDNTYFTIQSLNIALDEKPAEQASNHGVRISISESVPSAVTRVMIIFRAKMNCVAKEKVYDTTHGKLPLSFNDGTSTGGFYDNLLIKDQGSKNGTHVLIDAKYINTTIVLRRVGTYLSVSVVSPEDVSLAVPAHGRSDEDFHMELCSAGCPVKETLSLSQASHLAAAGGPTVSPEKARKMCQHLPGFFRESCEFDVLTTGDSSFVQLGQVSAEDANRLSPRSLFDIHTSSHSTHSQGSNSDHNFKLSSGSRGVAYPSSLLLCTLVLISGGGILSGRLRCRLILFLVFIFQLKCSASESAGATFHVDSCSL